MTDKRRHRAIEKARKKLFIHYKKSHQQRLRSAMNGLQAFVEVISKNVGRAIKEITR